jgi:PPOX class probable F420-dependent enzyme
VSGERVLKFVGAHHNAVLATYHADGRIQQSPVTVGLDAEGQVIISSRETAVKVRNLLRDPRMSLVVMTERFIGDWLLIEGEAEIVHLPEAMDGLVSYYRDLAGEHPDWDDYRAAMIRDQRVLIRITATKVGPTIMG